MRTFSCIFLVSHYFATKYLTYIFNVCLEEFVFFNLRLLWQIKWDLVIHLSRRFILFSFMNSCIYLWVLFFELLNLFVHSKLVSLLYVKIEIDDTKWFQVSVIFAFLKKKRKSSSCTYNFVVFIQQSSNHFLTQISIPTIVIEIIFKEILALVTSPFPPPKVAYKLCARESVGEVPLKLPNPLKIWLNN